MRERGGGARALQHLCRPPESVRSTDWEKSSVSFESSKERDAAAHQLFWKKKIWQALTHKIVTLLVWVEKTITLVKRIFINWIWTVDHRVCVSTMWPSIQLHFAERAGVNQTVASKATKNKIKINNLSLWPDLFLLTLKIVKKIKDRYWLWRQQQQQQQLQQQQLQQQQHQQDEDAEQNLSLITFSPKISSRKKKLTKNSKQFWPASETKNDFLNLEAKKKQKLFRSQNWEKKKFRKISSHFFRNRKITESSENKDR